MELQLLSLPFLVSLFIVSVVLIKKASKSKTNQWMALPPGPWKLPLIGSIHHIATALPHRALTRLGHEHGPIMHLQVGQIDLVVVSSREAAREVMKVKDVHFAYRPEMAAPKIVCYDCTDIVFSSGPYWRQLRKICVMELLSANRVRSFASLRKEEIHGLLKEVAEAPPGTPLDLSAMLMSLANTIVSRASFGKKFNQQQRLFPLLKEGIELTSGFSISDVFPSLNFLDVKMTLQLRRIHREIDEILDDVVKERLRQRRKEGEEEDLVDVLLKAREQGDLEVPISFDNIKAVILDMFAGGTETTSSVIEWTMAELIKNPKEMVKVKEEVTTVLKGKTKIDENDVAQLSYLKLVIKESLRLHPPLPLLMPRVCKEQCQLLDYTIPAGTRVVVNAWSLGRDPRYWEDADSFRPERFVNSTVDYRGNNFEFVPFGAGRRICPGMAFGLASVELGLAQLLFHFDWKLPEGMGPEDLDMTETFGMSAVRKEPLRLVPTVHIPLPEL